MRRFLMKIEINPFQSGNLFLGHANSADPVMMLHSATSEQGLHCLLTGISRQNTITRPVHVQDSLPVGILPIT